MNKKNLCPLGWLAAGMVVCLTMSSCRTFDDTQALTKEDIAFKDERADTTISSAPFEADDLLQIDVQLVAFHMKDVERLYLARNMTKEGLFRLWSAGKAKLVSSASCMARLGEESIVQDAQEILYPTEFSITNGIVTPLNNTMRQAGSILQVLPRSLRFEEQNEIDVTLKPQWVKLERWESTPTEIPSIWRHKVNPLRQPVFGCISFETSVSVRAGDTVLIGSASTSDGEWVNAGFLTVRRLNAQSQK